jgi:predicted O-linked N-acetylglucosamine transferase (SPINDLY family)
LRRLPEALTAYDKTLAATPDDARGWKSRGAVLCDMNRMDEALASFDRALSLKPDYADALHRRGNLLWAAKRDLSAAVRDLEKAMRADPELDYLSGDLLHLKMQGADWRDYAEQAAATLARVRAGRRVVQPLYFLAISDSPDAILASSRTYNEHLYPAVPGPRKRDIIRRGKIRLGYLGSDFRQHPVGFLSVGLFEHHDKSKFEIIAFDIGGDDGSQTRKRMQAAFDKIVDLSGEPDQAAAQMIEREDVDILLDMNGYTRHHRMGILARRPAPIQAGYLGFPGTTGAPYMDYIIADRILIPENERQFYSEQIVHLPETYQANDSKRLFPQHKPERSGCGLPEKSFVFANFNHIHKLTPAIFRVWMRIMREVPGSVLWLLEANAQCSENLRREAAASGVAGERLIFAPQVSQDAHIARLGLADLSLDTSPYNAHTTASDALWVGVPMVTCRGGSFAARVAASLLHAVNLPELVTESLEAYENLILDLARDGRRLQAIRERLAHERLTAPLFDTGRYCRHIEAAYTMMWERFREGEPPQAFAVPPAVANGN